MSKQQCTIDQSNKVAEKMYDGFQTIENVIIQIFRMLDEHDKLIKVVKNEYEKLGGEDLE